MPAPTTPAYRMADRLVGGELSAQLASYRRAGVAWKAIARLLQQEYGVEASSETLASWAVDLGIESAAEQAAS